MYYYFMIIITKFSGFLKHMWHMIMYYLSGAFTILINALSIIDQIWQIIWQKMVKSEPTLQILNIVFRMDASLKNYNYLII